jgi:threonine dehydrogenase-like Zn-dependent dehydrogenase
VPAGLSDEQVLFLSDIFPTGYMAAEQSNIQPGSIVAVWGCGPVGQFAIASAYLLGAERVIAIDRFEYRMRIARERAGAETINYEETDVYEAIREMTGGRGADACIDAVGMEAHAANAWHYYDKAKTMLMLGTERGAAVRQAIMCFGAVVNRSLTIKSGQTHVHRYLRPLLKRILDGEIDPSFIITHRLPLDEAPHAYDIFTNKEDGCLKVVLKAA